MKKVFFCLLLGALIIGFTACNEPVEIKTDATLAISVTNITSMGALISVTGTPANAYYYFDVTDAASVQEFGLDTIAQYYLDYQKEDWEYYQEDYLAEDPTLTFASLYLSQGADEYDYAELLNPATEWVVVAFFVDSATLNITGEVYSQSFTTPAAQPSSNTFQVTTSETGFTITPSNEDTYYWTIYEKDTVATYGAGLLWNEEIQFWYDFGWLPYFTSYGVEEWAYCENLEAPGDYTIVIAGCEGTYQTTEISTFDLTITSEQIAAGGCEEEEDIDFAPRRNTNKKLVTPTQPTKVMVKKQMTRH